MERGIILSRGMERASKFFIPWSNFQNRLSYPTWNPTVIGRMTKKIGKMYTHGRHL